MNTRRGRRKVKVLVVGDVAVDWLEQSIPRTEKQQQRNYQLYPGFHWTAVWGGAVLVTRLVRAALKPRKLAAEVTCEHETDNVLDDKERKWRTCLQSLAVVKRTEQDKKMTIKVNTFKGFSEPKCAPTLAGIPRNYSLRVDCLVIDDAANGCRWEPSFAGELAKAVKNAPLIVVKLSRPLDSSSLLNVLPKAGQTKRVVIVVNADDLRAQGVAISRRLSWERTATDLVSASHEAPILRRLCDIGEVLVRLGNDGCVVLSHDQSNHLVFDPRGTEKDLFDEQVGGTMPGATSAFVAAIVAALLQRKPQPLLEAAQAALAAARTLLTLGFHCDKDNELSYPMDVFLTPSATGATKGKTQAGIKADDFVKVALPSKLSSHENWSILSARLGNDHRLARSIVLRDPKTILRDVPIAEYGKLLLIDRREIEGYHSVENLLHEYISGASAKNPQPLSIAVFGPPGSGKSFGIKEIAKSIQGSEIKDYTFNLTQLTGPDDLVGAFHIARDEALRGRLPLMLFDEFDCAFNNAAWGWIKYFLAPMQDGEFKEGELIHPLGRSIFVFAGGTASEFAKFSAAPAEISQQANFISAKVPDFVSRLHGFVDVQGINSDSGVDPMCVARRAILLRSLLLKQEKRTENLFPLVKIGNATKETRHLQINDAVLDAFLQVKTYRHGARSLEAILKMSRLDGRDSFSVAALPSEAQLKLHVDDSFVEILRKHVSEGTVDKPISA